MEEEKSGLQPTAEGVPDATGDTAKTGESAAPAGSPSGSGAAEGNPATAEEFEELITGRYRDAYRSRVSAIVKDRLKASKETEKKYEKLAPAIEALAVRYGVGADDTEGLLHAMGGDPGGKEAAGSSDADAGAETVYAGWIDQAEKAKERFPSLDLEGEISNPEFASLLLGGVDVERAYVAAHADEILPAVMKFAVREAGRKMAGRLADNDARATENGAVSRSAALPLSDVRSLSRAQRQEIIRRVGRGEVIRF
ncbi:MAG: hypothetical protein IKI03_10630 [Clostridia bacterium]|nr:hypothetical protein [Clostridia bacterium]